MDYFMSLKLENAQAVMGCRLIGRRHIAGDVIVLDIIEHAIENA